MKFLGLNKISVTQGSMAVTKKDDELLTAILGSCVAVCAYDPLRRFGGMNHILLPGSHNAHAHSRADAYAVNLMELLFNKLFQMGATKSSLELKIFGGANVLQSAIGIGQQNAEFVLRYVSLEGYNVVSESLGGQLGRRIEFHPSTGSSRQKYLSDRSIVEPSKPRVVEPQAGKVELF